MLISEKLRLLGSYQDIPQTLTISAMTTELELMLVSSEDYYQSMIDDIFPNIISEKFNYLNLLEVDFQWICRCLRILSYGPETTITAITCPDCGQVSYGEYKINFNSVGCSEIPNRLRSGRDVIYIGDNEFWYHLLTMKEVISLSDQPDVHKLVSMICGYSHYIDDDIETKLYWVNKLSCAEYVILSSKLKEVSNLGLCDRGNVQCPKCFSKNSVFILPKDDKFFVRPWELSNRDSETLNVQGKIKTFQEVRQQLYENIVDETLFVSRASEGSVSAEWIMKQPVLIRKKYVDVFTKELKERERSTKKHK